MELYLNNELFFLNEMKTFSFNETKYINSHIDYEYCQNTGEKYQKCFLDKNNHLSTNKQSTAESIGESLDDGEHNIKIIVKDSYSNSSTLEFKFQLKKKHDSIRLIDSKQMINSNQVFEFKNADCEIYIPEMSLYKDHIFTYEKQIDPLMTYPIYQILDNSIPSHKGFIISIKTDSLDKNLRQKAVQNDVKS